MPQRGLVLDSGGGDGGRGSGVWVERMEFLTLAFKAILAFLTDWAVELGASAAVLAIVETVFSPFRRMMAKYRTPEKVEVVNPSPPLSQPVPSEPLLSMTLAQFENKQRELRDRITAEMQTAHKDEMAQLRNQMDTVNARLREPEKALEEAKVRIADLEARLAREGNQIGPERLAEARAALARLDYSVADEIFAEIEARNALAVEESARVAFGRGEVAEAEIRWADAADHYARSAALNPDFDSLFKARLFAWRTGTYADALRWGEQLLATARASEDQSQLAAALNEHALSLKAMGRYDDAEPLYRQALEIGAATIGRAHPAYATHLNNLAVLHMDQERWAEAEPLMA